MRSALTHPRLLAAACFTAAAVASCHNHDDDLAGAFFGGGGSAGQFLFSPDPPNTRAGEIEDFFVVQADGQPAVITEWELIDGPAGQLVDRGVQDSIRFVAGPLGVYTLRARDAEGREGTLTFEVTSSAAELTVSETVDGTDTDEVSARIDARTNDLFIADRVGDATAPQRFARANRAGDRLIETTLPYKVEDLACDALGNVVTLQSAVAVGGALPDALRRFDRDLVEDTGFQAPALAAGETWQDRVTTTRAGEIVLVTSYDGGSLLYLDATGAPLSGTVADSLVPLPFLAGDVVDVTADNEDAIYVATRTEIVRVLATGSIDQGDWNAEPREAIVAIAADDNGVVLVSCQDQDGGQCGSLRKLNWTGAQTGLLIDFNQGTFFAPRKFLRPLDLAAYPDGSWRIYDDTESLTVIEVNAAWIVAADAPPSGGE